MNIHNHNNYNDRSCLKINPFVFLKSRTQIKQGFICWHCNANKVRSNRVKDKDKVRDQKDIKDTNRYSNLILMNWTYNRQKRYR